MEEQVVVIYAASTATSTRCRSTGCARSRGLLAAVRSNNADVLETIRSSRDLDDATAAKLKSAVEAYAKTFA